MISYVLAVSLMLCACYCCYLVLLQRQTFYILNRYVLLAFMPLSFCLPLIPVPSQWSVRDDLVKAFAKPDVSNGRKFSKIPEAIRDKTFAGSNQGPASSIPVIGVTSLTKVLTYVYWTGVVVFGLNFIVQIVSLVFQIVKRPRIKSGRYCIVELDGDKSPCSFLNYIFINPAKYEWAVYQDILHHEKVHVNGWHTADILLAELMIVVLWFNPFAWLHRRAVENNLEFLTDHQLLKNGTVDKTAYQFNLVKVALPDFPLGVTINYNQSLLKKRILMMNAKRSSLGSLWKYFFVLPMLIAVATVINKPVLLAQQQSLTPRSFDNNQFTLSGKLVGVEKATILISYVDADGKAVTDQSTLKNGNFYFSGKIAVPTLAMISEAKGMGVAQVFLEPGEMTATVQKNKFREMVITGSKNQLESDSLMLLVEPIVKKSWGLEVAYLEANNKLIVADLGKADQTVIASLKVNAQKALDAVDPATGAVAAIVYRFAEQHPDSYHSAWQINVYHKRWSLDSTRRVYNKMSSAIQLSKYGRELKDLIERGQ